MIKRSFNMKLILCLIISSLILLTSCKQFKFNNNENNIASTSDALIGIANLSNDENELIKIGGANNFYVFEVKNSKEKNKKVSCWIDQYENGKFKTSLGKMTAELLGDDKLKYITIALNNSSTDNKRQIITSIISNNSMAQGSTFNEVDLKLGQASGANQEQKFIVGEDINLAMFIGNEGSTSIFNSITENMNEILKNKSVYIFKCKVEN